MREYRNIHGTGETVALAILAAAGMLIIGLTVVQVDFGLLAALVVVTLVGAVVLLARGSGTLAAFVLILGLAVSVAIVVFDKVRFGYVVAMAVVTAAAVWLTL